IDRLFFAEALPTPTFGTGGILWASLTLALLTVPVVIVATEEGLAAIPGGMREASLALSATKLETTLRVVLPAVMPSILTGLILVIVVCLNLFAIATRNRLRRKYATSAV